MSDPRMANRLRLRDPLYAASLRLLRTPKRAAMAAGVAQMGLWAAVGLYFQHTCPPGSFVGITDSAELAWAPFVFAIVAPVLWGYYLWMPSATTSALQSLLDNGVVACVDLRDVVPGATHEKPSKRRRFRSVGRWIPAAAVALMSCVVVSVWLSDFVAYDVNSGRVSFWFKADWSTCIIGGIVWIDSYVGLQIVARAVALAIKLRTVFGRAGVRRVIAAHPDGSGGLGALGSVAVRISYLAVLVGVWAVWFTLLPLVYGARMNWGLGTVGLYCLYLVAVPGTLLALLMPAHRSMSRYRAARLAALAGEMEYLVSRTIDSRVPLGRRLLDVRAAYASVEATPTWPLKWSSHRGFRLAALVPALTGIVTAAIDIALKLT